MKNSLHSLIGKTILTLSSSLFFQISIASPDQHYSDEYLATQIQPTVRVTMESTEEIVLAADNSNCNEVDEYGNRMDVPDAPLRATRWKGHIIAVAAHYNNILYYSKDNLRTIKHDNCTSAFRSEKKPDPSSFADHQWLTSLYTSNDKIFGLIHNEYWGGAHNLFCKLRLGTRPPWESICLYVNLTSAISSDGKKFKKINTVAAYPYKFSTDMNRAGIRDPSNIFYNPLDGHVYFMAWIDAYKDQQGGMCLFRSTDPFRRPWLAWDGTGFNVYMNSPYERKEGELPRFCKPVSGLWITTVVYYEPAKSFIALAFDERIAPGGVFYRTSKDLIHWSKAKFLMEGHDFHFWKKRGAPAPIVYPSLLDPESGSTNFDVTGSNPWLYFQRARTRDGQALGRERDIIRIRVKITPVATENLSTNQQVRPNISSNPQ